MQKLPLKTVISYKNCHLYCRLQYENEIRAGLLELLWHRGHLLRHVPTYPFATCYRQNTPKGQGNYEKMQGILAIKC